MTLCFLDYFFDNHFLDMTIKENVINWTYKCKMFMLKRDHREMKMQAADWNKVFVNNIFRICCSI